MNIYSASDLWHPEAFVQNRYTRAYRVLIERALAEKRSKENGKYQEHHIVPESFFKNSRRGRKNGWIDGDPDALENLVLLTIEEHARAHIFLARKMTEGVGKRKMSVALMPTLGAAKNLRISSRLLAECWRISIEARSDMTIYTFIHDDGRTFTGTRVNFTDTMKIDAWRLFAKGRRSWHGWRLSKTPDKATRRLEWQAKRTIAQTDFTIYTFVHKSGRIFKGTRHEFMTSTKIDPKPLFRAGLKNLTVHDWCLEGTIVPTWQIHTFVHQDGRTFNGTADDFKAMTGFSPRNLFRRKNPNKSIHGWSLLSGST